MPTRLALAVFAISLLSVGCARTRTLGITQTTPVACTIRDVDVEVTDVERDGVTAFHVSATACALTRAVTIQALLDRLLFLGVPQSTQTTPMLDQPERHREHPPKELQQLRETGWSQFVVSSESYSAGGYAIRYDVNGLRKWLERNRLARKFGLP